MLTPRYDTYSPFVVSGMQQCVTAKRKGRRKAEGKTRKETRKGGEHLDRKPLEGDKLKLT